MKSITLPTIVLFGMLTSTAAAQPMLSITKKCPTLRYLGRNATFEITLTNTGDAPARDVVVTDTMTGGVNFISADQGGTRQGNNVVWRLGMLEAGQSRMLNVTVRCDKLGTVMNSVRATYCAEVVDSCDFEVKGIPAVLLECVDDPDPIELNGELTYTITVTNQGTALGTNIVIACTLPPEEEYVSSTGPTQATAMGKEITFAPLPSLAAKAKAVFKIKVKGVGEGDVRFRVEMNTDQLTSPVMETESTHIYE